MEYQKIDNELVVTEPKTYKLHELKQRKLQIQSNMQSIQESCDRGLANEQVELDNVDEMIAQSERLGIVEELASDEQLTQEETPEQNAV